MSAIGRVRWRLETGPRSPRLVIAGTPNAQEPMADENKQYNVRLPLRLLAAAHAQGSASGTRCDTQAPLIWVRFKVGEEVAIIGHAN